MRSAPLHHMSPDGKVTLSPSVVHLDDGRRIYRRRRTSLDRAHEVFFLYLLPACVLLFLVLCWVLIYWIGSAIERVLRGSA
jgi:hypothetical protein